MRSGLLKLASSTAFVVSGLVALASIAPAHAQPKPGAKPAAAPTAKPAAKPAGSAKPAAAPTAKPAAGKPDAKPPAGKPDAKTGGKPDAKDKDACATEPKPKLAEAKKKTEAKNAYKSAEAKFEKSDFEGALVCYKLADAYVPGAKPKFKIATAIDKLGKVTEAVAAYDTFFAFIKEGKPEDKLEEKYKEEIATAKSRTETLKQTPAKVKVAFNPPDAPNIKIEVDGAPQAGPELALAPGKHTIKAVADGYDPATQEIEVAFAETKDTTLTLNKTPPPPEPVVTATATATAVAVATATETAPVVAPPPPEKSNIPAYVTLGLAGAGAVMGGIFGGLALSSKGEFDQKPTVEKADETDRNALIADMSFAVALTFGVTGAVLLLSDTQPAGTPPAAPAKTGGVKPVKKAGVRGFIAPYATPNGAGAAARFTF